ncbi:hypothetical protein LUZ61_009085 [Rhynchospora tenuis]|uniref:F-box domain-containing protein n=1 Tax=Rhynchospora tenuis TaxID=198213 RepID=A0AAD5ZWQ9_9POAL|nr:hypothetical protein LUZ61_009085 [Rhynchospora tenuis]
MFPCGFGDQPWLIQARGSDKEAQMFVNPLNGSIEERNIYEMHGQLCLSRFEDWLFLVDDLSDDCFLLNIYSLTRIDLPPIEEPFSSLGVRTLTSSPTSPDCTIIFLGMEENFLLFCHPCDTEWTKLPVDFDVDGARNMLAYNGNLYVVLDDIEIIDLARPIQNDELLTSFETIARSEVCQKGCGMVKKDENVTGIYISMPLTNLPIDIVQSISEQLPLKDSVRLRGVCKFWAKQLPDPMKEEPMWLMSCPKKCGTCQMYSPWKGKQFTLNLKGHYSSDVPIRLLFSKDGWILMLKGSDLICLMNPFTNDFHHLPILEDDYCYNGIAFSCPPKNSTNCTVFAIVSPPRGDFTRIIAWHYGQEEWLEMQFDNDLPFSGTDNNPVFFDGEFYCLGRYGNLGVFNPENKTWRVLNKPSPIHSEAPDIGTEHCYLLECDGELISVFRAFNMEYLRVFKLDRSNMAWNLFEDLGDATLFLDYRTSIARNLPRKSFRNKVFLPRLHDETNETTFYYCMKTGMHNPNFKIFREPYNCVWLEPQFQ